MGIARFLVASGAAISLMACGGKPIPEGGSSIERGKNDTVASSSRAQGGRGPGESSSSSSSSSSLGVGECPPGFDHFPTMAVMDIELGINSGTFAWREFALPISMPRLEVAQKKNRSSRSRWAISFSLFPKAHACSLPDVTLVSYVQSFTVKAIQGDTSINLTPFMAAKNTSESGRLVTVDDAGVNYSLNEWNGLSKETNLGQAYFGSTIEDIENTKTELSLSFDREPPIIAQPVMLEVEAVFNDGTVIKRTTGMLTFN